MSDEKLYTQEDLNNAVTKAIADMNKVLESNTNELKALHKAYEMIALELACKNHCIGVLEVPDCLGVDGEKCAFFEECRNKKWLMDFYKSIAMEELEEELDDEYSD